MRLDLTFRSRLRPRQILAPALIAVTLALSACGGSSSNATGTAGPPSSTSVATATSATIATEASGMATSTASGATTATATTDTTPTATAAATQAPPTPTQAATATQAAAATQAPTTASGSSTGIAISAVPVLQDVADAWKQVTSYKMTMTFFDTTSNTQTGSATVESMKDKSHWVMDEGDQSIEIITIGTDYYLKLAGDWTKMTSDVSTTLPPFTSADILNDVSTPAAAPDSVTNKGTDTVNGVSCDVYEIKSDTGTSTLWVGHEDHLLYKGSFDDNGTRTEILFSDFNKQFDIQPPI